MRKIYTIAASLLLALGTMANASAQSTDFGGTTFNNDIIGWGDLYNLSFTSHNYGTARSMGMGNAFTALGADMISATLNPAGIGMFKANEVSLTPMMQFSKSPTTGGDPYYVGVPKRDQEFSDHTERFSMASIGGVFTAYRGTGALTRFNVGLVYNRIADFNHNSLNASIDNPATESMANILCTLSNVDGLQTRDDGTMPFGNDPYYWGAVLAYKNGLTNKDAQGWYIDRITPDAIIDQYSSVETRGGIGEYDLTFGFNFDGKVFLGASIGMQDVRYRRNVYYGEDYLYRGDDDALGYASEVKGGPSGEEYPYQVEYMGYMQRTSISGSGFNFKVGLTVLPVKWLRLGVAYHTPTYYSLAMRYDAEMWSRTYSAGNNPDDYPVGPKRLMYDDVYSGVWEDAGAYSWNFRSPSRLLLGVAVVPTDRFIVSVDYERSWYQSTRLQSSPITGLTTSYKETMKDVFKGGNTVRVGTEVNILPFLPVRLGYIWSGSTLREGYEDIIATHPIPTQQSIICAGFGLKFTKAIYLDFAYQYSTTKYTSYQTFYAIDSDLPEMDIESRIFNTKTMRHMALLTLGFRF